MDGESRIQDLHQAWALSQRNVLSLCMQAIRRITKQRQCLNRHDMILYHNVSNYHQDGIRIHGPLSSQAEFQNKNADTCF